MLLLTKIELAIHICVFAFATPYAWEFLRMPIIHILQTTHSELQTQKVEVWCKNKKCEYRYVAVAVSKRCVNSKKHVTETRK